MFRHADVVCLCLVCILWQFSMLHLHDFQFVNAGITDPALALMKSYLDGRKQCVQIEGGNF